MGGSDLIAVDIQRGRDHGLADYAAMRGHLGLAKGEEGSSNGGEIEQKGLSAKERAAFAKVQDAGGGSVDAIVGMAVEMASRTAGKRSGAKSGSVFGPLADHIVVNQFRRTRDGDRFWYRNRLDAADVRDIESCTGIRRILKRNLHYLDLGEEGVSVNVADGAKRNPNPNSNHSGNRSFFLDFDFDFD